MMQAARILFRQIFPKKRVHDYQRLYDEQARNNPENEVVGDGPYDAIGRMQLEVLLREGLKPDQTLVDFGCGNGRLARHAVAHLSRGQYVGIDICTEFLTRAARHIARVCPGSESRVQWRHQTSPRFPLPNACADMLCAYSVFTHMEHEDAYCYLTDARRVVRPGGRMVFSCLPLDLALSRDIFLYEAREDLATRWRRVRNVTTSKDMMTAIATMAGWTVAKWIDGTERFEVNGERIEFGQSCCVLLAE